MKHLGWLGLVATVALSFYALAARASGDDAVVELQTQIYQVSDNQASYNDTSMGEPELIALLRKLFPPIVEPSSGEMLSYMRYNLTIKQVVVHNTPENLRTIQKLFEVMKHERQPSPK